MKQLILIFLFLFTFSQSYSQSFDYQPAYSNQTSNDSNISTADLSIFPNPVKQNRITVKLKNQEIKEIRITNIVGKEVLVKKYQIPVNEKMLELNNMVDGIYLVRIKTTDNQQLVKKLMISRN